MKRGTKAWSLALLIDSDASDRGSIACFLTWVEKNHGQPLYPHALVSVNIVFSSASVCSALAALARKSRLFQSVVNKVHSASSGSKVASFQFKCSTKSTFWQPQLKVATVQ